MHYLGKAKHRIVILLAMLLGLSVYKFSTAAGVSNGFDLSNAILPVDQILHGGPPRDGIPALSNPKMIRAGEASYLSAQDRIVGINLGGQSRAYPISILNWHEIVNDAINGRRFAITYCPLCGTAVAFDARIDGRDTDFGVSGLLYNSDVLLYDRDSESLWSQIMKQSISGPRVGSRLTALPISHTSWSDWLHKHPDSLVMSDDTGYARDYSRDPYDGYETSRHTYFSVNNEAPDNYHPKEVVLGLAVDGVYKAYPFIELNRQGKSRFSDSVNGKQFHFDWDSANRSIEVSDAAGNKVAAIQGFWFAWFAFHPDTELFKAAN